MDENYDGGPAFPVQDASTWQAHGMSKRELFAAILMHAELATGGPNSENATRAVEGADDLLRALADRVEPDPRPAPAHLTYNPWGAPDVEHRAIQRLALSSNFADLPAVIRDFVTMAVSAIAETEDGIPF